MTCICQPTPCNNFKPSLNATVLTFQSHRQCQCSAATQQRHAKTRFSADGATRFVSIHSTPLHFLLPFKAVTTPAFSGTNKPCLHRRQGLFGIETRLVSMPKKPYSGFATGLSTVFPCPSTPKMGVLRPRKLLDLQLSPSKYFTTKPVILTITVR